MFRLCRHYRKAGGTCGTSGVVASLKDLQPCSSSPYDAPIILDPKHIRTLDIQTSLKSSRMWELAQMAHEGEVDIHSHFLPPFYCQACLNNGHGMLDGMLALPVLYCHQKLL